MHKRSLSWLMAPALAAIAVWLLWPSGNPGPPAPPPPEAPARAVHTTASTPAGAPQAATLNAPDSSATEDLAMLRGIVREFLNVVKEPYRRPIGVNEDLAAALRGDNPLKTVFIPANHPAFDSAGRLVDRWGTPLFVHPLSADSFDIVSAGPDRELFTDDDIPAP